MASKRDKARKAAGLCQRCGIPRGEDGSATFCRVHQLEMNLYSCQSRSKIVTEHYLQGLCARCKEPCVPGIVAQLCEYHLKERKRHQDRRKKLKHLSMA